MAIPAYKASFLEEAVRSVVCQTFQDWELVIVDDCSPADLRAIVSPFLHDSRVHYYRNSRNFGALDVVDNWNKCLEYCTGEYVICMGDDDRLLPGCLEDLAVLIEKYPSLGVYHIQAEKIDGSGRVSESLESRPEFEDALEMILRRWRGREQYVGDFCFRADLLMRNGGFYKLPLAWGSDDVTSFLAARGDGEAITDGVANTGRPGFQYRENTETITASGNSDTKMEAMTLCADWFEGYFASCTPRSEADAKRINAAAQEGRAHFKDVFRDYVKKDVGADPARLGHWLKERRSCRLSAPDICYQGLKGIVRRLLAVLLMVIVAVPAAGASGVRPEDFGARGDGVWDDAPAFNKCISSGRPVDLQTGKTYLLKSRLEGITADRFNLRGNGAVIVVDADYPLRQYDNIFCFCDGSYTRKFFKISDVYVLFMPGQKFRDRNAIGDSFFLYVENCGEVAINNVHFDSPSAYNNLTFFSSFGVRKLTMTSCSVRLNTLSKQGGIVWLMNKYMPRTTVKLKNCRFEHDAWDETVCFAIADTPEVQTSRIKAVVNNCTFESACNSPSSGFVIIYNHSPAYADISTTFSNCIFRAPGTNIRKIVSYQTGSGNESSYGRLHTLFSNSSFDFSPSAGRDGLVSPADESVLNADTATEFRNCTFKQTTLR